MSLRLIFTISILCFFRLPATIVRAEDWPQFRGPGGLGVSADAGVPVSWGFDTNLAWKTQLPGAGSSSPIVVGNQIFLTCFSGYGVDRDNPGDISRLKRHLICLDRASGKVIWWRDVAAKLPENSPGKHGYATSTPVSDGKSVFVFFGKSGVFAFDLQGKALWHASVGEASHGYGSSASPILYKDLLIINASAESHALVALDKNTGNAVWHAVFFNSGAAYSTPVLVEVSPGRTELALCISTESASNKLFGFDPQTGRELWSAGISTRYTCASAVAHAGIVYVVAIDACAAVRAGGHGDVTRSHVLWQKQCEGVVASPVVHAGYLYFVRDSGNVSCLKTDDGTTVYSKRANRGSEEKLMRPSCWRIKSSTSSTAPAMPGSSVPALNSSCWPTTPSLETTVSFTPARR